MIAKFMVSLMFVVGSAMASDIIVEINGLPNSSITTLGAQQESQYVAIQDNVGQQYGSSHLEAGESPRSSYALASLKLVSIGVLTGGLQYSQLLFNDPLSNFMVSVLSVLIGPRVFYGNMDAHRDYQHRNQ